jgi:hypothetical protein
VWGQISVKITWVLNAYKLDGVIAGSNLYDILVIKVDGIVTIDADDRLVLCLYRDCNGRSFCENQGAIDGKVRCYSNQ